MRVRGLLASPKKRCFFLFQFRCILWTSVGFVDFGGGVRLASDHCSMPMRTRRTCPGLGLYRLCGELLVVLLDTCDSMCLPHVYTRYLRHVVLSTLECPLTSHCSLHHQHFGSGARACRCAAASPGFCGCLIFLRSPRLLSVSRLLGFRCDSPSHGGITPCGS